MSLRQNRFRRRSLPRAVAVRLQTMLPTVYDRRCATNLQTAAVRLDEIDVNPWNAAWNVDPKPLVWTMTADEVAANPDL